MTTLKKIKAGKKYVQALVMPLESKRLIVLRGRRGYIMCGYLNLEVAEKFNDVAVKVTGISSIKDALKATVHSCTSRARKLGIHPGDSVKDVLKIIV